MHESGPPLSLFLSLFRSLWSVPFPPTISTGGNVETIASLTLSSLSLFRSIVLVCSFPSTCFDDMTHLVIFRPSAKDSLVQYAKTAASEYSSSPPSLIAPSSSFSPELTTEEFFHPSNFVAETTLGGEEWEAVSAAGSEVSFEWMEEDEDTRARSWADVARDGAGGEEGG